MRSFTGITSVPMRVEADGRKFSLERLEILSSGMTALAAYTKAQLRAELRRLDSAVRITVILTPGSTAPATVPITRGTGGPGNLPDPEYVPITSVYADPSQILVEPDTAFTLGRLREIASPTSQYHDDLFEIVHDAREIDVPHLHLLVDAAYFTYAARAAMAEERERLYRESPRESRERIELLGRRIQLADELGGKTNEILEHGIAKLDALSADDALALIAKAFPFGVSNSIVSAAIAKLREALGTLPAALKLALLQAALDKGATAVAADLGAEWFREDSDHQVATLLALTDRFSYGSKDRLLLAALAAVGELTQPEAVRIVAAAYSEKARIGLAALGKVRNLTAVTVAAVAAELSYGAKDSLIRASLTLLGALTGADVRFLTAAGYGEKVTIAVEALAKVVSLEVSAAVAVASELSYGARDTWLLAALAKIPSMTSAQAASLVEAGYGDKVGIAIGALPRISGLDGRGAVAVASELSYGAKDTWLRAAVAAIRTLRQAEAVVVVGAGYGEKLEIAKLAVHRIAPLTAAGVVAVAGELSYAAKDTLAIEGVGLLRSLTAGDAASVVAAGYGSKLDIALAALPKVAPLTAAGVVTIAEQLSYGAKDSFVKRGRERLGRVTARELAALAGAGYGERAAILVAGLPSVSDLTAATAVYLAEQVSYGNKDTVVSFFLGRVAAVTTDELLALFGAAYGERANVVMNHLAKVTDLTVANAIRLAEVLQYGNKDTLLLDAVDRVTDLAVSNVMALSQAGYSRKQEILEKGLRRLGSR